MWYVIRTTVGQEEKYLDNIRSALQPVEGSTAFLPMSIRAVKYGAEWHMTKSLLFPGCIFVSTQQPDQVEKLLRIFTRGVQPIRIGGGFNPISPQEQDFLQSMMDSEYVIGNSSGNIVNGTLVVDAGPLTDKTESVVWIDRHHRCADVAMTMWGEQQRIRVGLEVIRKS